MKNIWENYNFNDMGKEKTTNKELKVEEFRNVKDTFNTIQEWVSNQDKDKVKLVKGERVYDGRLRQFQDTMDWFDEMNKLNEESKSLLFGEATLTIEDIKEKMLLHLKGSEELLENTPDEDEDEGKGDTTFNVDGDTIGTFNVDGDGLSSLNLSLNSSIFHTR